MTDSDLLDPLDRRARAAADELNDAVASVEVPRFDQSSGRKGSVRRDVFAAVAAAIVVVALGAAGFALLGGGEGSSPVATSGEPTHFVLPEPEASGYQLSAAVDGARSAVQASGSPYTGPVTVQGPEASDDPWDAALVEYELPSDMTTLDGEPVDVGGPEATAVTGDFANTMAWVDGDTVRYLMSARLSTDELADIARVAVSEGTPSGAPMPGQTILFSGSIQDTFPVFGTTVGSAGGIDALYYEATDGGTQGFVIGVTPGNEASWKAAVALARQQERTTIRGHEAVIAEFDQDLYEISWLEDDGTLVRVDVAGIDPAALVPVLDQLVPVTAAEFAELVADHAPPGVSDDGSTTSETFEGQGTELPAGQQLASITTGGAGWSATVTVRVDDAGNPILDSEVAWPNSGSGGEADLEGLEVNDAFAAVLDDLDGLVLVYGLIGPSVTEVEVRDAQTGAVTTGSGPSTATIPGSDRVLFLAMVDPQWGNRELLVVGRTATGEEIRVPFPN